MNSCKRIFQKNKHIIPLLIYGAIYLAWFAWLERTNVKDFRVIHMALDDYIPFCELFVIPYFLWFGYVTAVVIYLFFKNKQDYYKMFAFLCTGMTLFLIISTIWPNGHELRLSVMPRENFLTDMVAALWRTDTATNLWPSIHVFNSMGAHFAVMHSREIAASKWHAPVRIGSAVLATSIILSTMFIKQHSVFDVITGLLLGIVMYVLVYRSEWLLSGRPEKREKRAPQVK